MNKNRKNILTSGVRLEKTLLLLFLCLSLGAQAQKIHIKTGIEVLKSQNFRCLEGKRVGLITNPTGVDNELRSTIDILHEAPNVNLVALYGPEHGVRGDVHAGDHVSDQRDPATGLPVYSLYGKTRKATPEMLKDVDVLVYDIQDIGCRSFTYISTLGLAMEAAAENGKELIVLDRPNPLGGLKVEGNLTEDDCISFVSQFKIPYVYGLTCGELALMLNGERMLTGGVQCNLTVIKMKGWKRRMDYTATGLQWIPSSPHIPHPHSAFFYPVSGILGELGYMSIGVGYTIPFQMFAAPWAEADKLADALNALHVPGVIFRPIYLKPRTGTATARRTGAHHRLRPRAAQPPAIPRNAGSSPSVARPRRLRPCRQGPLRNVRQGMRFAPDTRTLHEDQSLGGHTALLGKGRGEFPPTV